MYLSRSIEIKIINHLQQRREILIVYGARQVGKSTLINNVLDNIDQKSIRISGEDMRFQTIFSSRDSRKMSEVVEGYDILFIDEAQYIEEIGINIKLLFDTNRHLKIILSGSSSFELANNIKEPLTGRTRTILLYPLGFEELKSTFNTFELKEHLKDYLIFGGYPGLYHLNNKKDKISAILELSSAYLYKDILMFHNLRKTKMLFKLLQLLSLQIGSPVSIHELANNLNSSSETVERYIQLLEQSFVLFRLSAFSGNLRKEISKMDKIYFFDIGIRNAVIENFSDFSNRNDMGALWENFLVTERLKLIRYNELHRQSFFWRTYSGVELDYVEKWDNDLFGYEFKWGKKSPKIPVTWRKNFPNAKYKAINQSNFMEFVLLSSDENE